MTRTLRGIADWSELGPLEDWPDVCAFVTDGEPDWEAAAYLRSGTAFAWRQTPYRCTLCGLPNGQAVLTDGRQYVWLEGLAHYVEAHGVHLPVRWEGTAGPVDVSWFEDALMNTGEVTVDQTWWRSQARDVATHLPGCWRSPVRRAWNLPRFADIWVDGVPAGDVATMARLRRLFGADWLFSGLRDRIAGQPFLAVTAGDPAEFNRVTDLRDYLFYDTPDGLLSVKPDA
ncbi:hypothetical protein FHR83_009266 [Actinoplanes campanulatus]|uniref:Uncharacterized protein n=1 Tax=Actinoplanes campanulatus TaxID=113559 RepID=A0A7W5ASD0_9ACTN|nr:hypothetical protein [Actinoplanes campanulatus]MBB3101537.1 hypothetical protein [Actinoplanes campanulatus]GGN51894.1 hypothetical protein GCM10010109_92430 [Actinoplanes campanulatus]GID42696.1 hypothetical protein Aca09nite_92020 [Actinoplanes campanulatus]